MVCMGVCLCVHVYHLLITKRLSVWLLVSHLWCICVWVCSNSKYWLSGTHIAYVRKTQLAYSPPLTIHTCSQQSLVTSQYWWCLLSFSIDTPSSLSPYPPAVDIFSQVPCSLSLGVRNCVSQLIHTNPRWTTSFGVQRYRLVCVWVCVSWSSTPSR